MPSEMAVQSPYNVCADARPGLCCDRLIDIINNTIKLIKHYDNRLTCAN